MFTTLDLASGYWAVPMKEEDKHKTAFAAAGTGQHLQWRVCPFGYPGSFILKQTAVIMDCFVVANFGFSLSSTTAWIAMLESAAMSAEFKDELRVVGLRLPAANGKPITHEIFDQIVPKAQAYARSRKWEAQRRRQTTTSTTENDIDGFRVIDLLNHLYETIPGLCEYGFSKSAVYRLFQPARTDSIDAKSYHRVIDARVSKNLTRLVPTSAALDKGSDEAT